jgi:ABC transporter DrrB family efflux protein
MKVRRTLAFSRRVLKQLRHDKRTFAFILLMPLIMIVVFGYTFAGDVKNVSVILVNEDQSATVPVPGNGAGNFTYVNLTFGDYIDKGLNRDTLSIRTSEDFNGSKENVRTSQFFQKSWAVIYIPKDFSKVFAQYLGKVALSKAMTNKTVCEATGYFWYDGSCHPFQSSNAEKYAVKSDCQKAGFKWYSNKCHEDFTDKVKWTPTECNSHGYFWYDDICHDGADLTIYIDGSNPNIKGTVQKTVMDALLKAQTEVFAKNPALRRFQVDSPVVTRDDYAFGTGDIRFIDAFAPGIMAFAMLMVTTMITIFLFIEERKMGTLERLQASPATETEIVVGYALAFSLVSVAQATVILLTALGLFHIYIAPPVWYHILITYGFLILLGMGHQCLGILLSSGAKNELQAIQFVPLIIFPSILLCGLLFPIESIPQYLRPISYIIPLTYCIDAVRGAMIRGLGLESLCCNGLALFVFLAVMLFGAIMLLKRRS